jgi:hypothetical protein
VLPLHSPPKGLIYLPQFSNSKTRNEPLLKASVLQHCVGVPVAFSLCLVVEQNATFFSGATSDFPPKKKPKHIDSHDNTTLMYAPFAINQNQKDLRLPGLNWLAQQDKEKESEADAQTIEVNDDDDTAAEHQVGLIDREDIDTRDIFKYL